MFEALVILVLILGNGALAMAEIAIVSARRARLKQRAESGDAGARAALELAETPSQFLATVQIGITLVGILAGAFAGATLAEPIGAVLSQIPFLAPYADQVAFVLVVAVITYISLLIGELVPKRLALTNPERIASALAPAMRVLARVAGPLVRFLTFSTEAVMRLLGVKETSEQTVTEEELKIMLDEGTATGVFEPSEREMVGRVFRLSDLAVHDLMTPRLEIVALDVRDSDEVLRAKLAAHSHSRFPVVEEDPDNVLGIVKTKYLLAQLISGKPIDVRAAMQPPIFVPEAMPAFDMLEKFKAEQTDIAIVIDEYGSVQGVVTIHDLAEAIVGDVPLTDDRRESAFVERSDGSWLVDGRAAIHEFKEKLDIKSLPDEQEGHYQTVGGFAMARLGRIPAAGDNFQWDDWHGEVVDMDGRRVDKVLVSRAVNQDSRDGK